jgi:hypothetical protein
MSSSNPNTQTILFLAANPKDTGRLRLDQELRDIAEGLQRAQKRDQFNLEQRLAVRPRDIQRAMLDVGPQIIHFSGHGAGEQGLVFEDEIGNAKLVDGAALAELFRLFAEQINCVVLNGCYSDMQAKAIAHHIPYVIGMSQAIGDKAAIAFAVGFYDALGAGRDVEFAYKLGCAAIRMEGIAEHLTPVLLKQSTTAPNPLHNSNVEQPVSLLSLTVEQRKQLRAALISAFPRQSDLELMIEDELGESFNLITQGQPNYELAVRDLVKWAETKGKVQPLLEGALQSNPGNPKLQEIAKLWLKK